MIIKKLILTYFIFFLIIQFLNAKSYDFSRVGFRENKGQIVNQYGKPRNDILFYYHNNSLNLSLKRNSFSYEIFKAIRTHKKDLKTQRDYKKNSIDKKEFRVHRIDVELINANKNPEIETEGKTFDYTNYILNKNKKIKINNVHSYQKITYKNIYKNIDLVFYYNKSKTNTAQDKFFSNIKYDFIVRPGGNINDIKLKYNGAENIKLINGNKLSIKTSIANIIENIHRSIIAEDNSLVNVSFKLHNKTVSFYVEKKANNKTLIIDPYLMFGTYYGDTNDDVGLGVCTDKNDNVIIVGFTTSTENIATSGAYQTVLAGESDAFIVKFNSAGQRLWATYYGAGAYDTGHTVTCDKDDNIIIAGWTKSKTGMATPGAYQTRYGGGEIDSYFAKFGSSGQLIWSSYFGGLFDDNINDITIDGFSNIIFVGRTTSLYNISSRGSYQEVFGGVNDAFISKFNTNGNRLWSTFYGGSGFDVGMEVCTDIFNDIIIAGYTQSSDSMASKDAFKDSVEGIWDAFLAKFSSDGQRIWGTYYGGQKNDFGWGVACDGENNISLIGYTNSTNGIATSGVHQEGLASKESDAFIAKFNSQGNRLWGTYYGGQDEDNGNAGAINPWNELFVNGDTYSYDSIATEDGFKTENSGEKDAFISVFDSLGHLTYGTFYGGSDYEYGHGIDFDSKARYYITGYTKSTYNIATAGAYQTELAGDEDAYLAKFGDPLPDDSIWIDNLSGVWCADSYIEIPYFTDGTFTSENKFIAQLSNASGQFVQFLDIGSINATGSGTITAYIPRQVITSNHYRIRVISTLPKIIGKDNGIDITFNELPKPEIEGSNVVCSTHFENYRAKDKTGFDYLWSVTGGIIFGENNQDTLLVKWQDSGKAEIKLIEINKITSCMDSIIDEIDVYPKIEIPEITGDDKVCPNISTFYQTLNLSGVLNKWIVKGGEIIGPDSSSVIEIKWKEDTLGLIKLIQTSEVSGCKDSNEIDIEIFDLPKPYIIGDTNVAVNSIHSYKTTSSSKIKNQWSVVGGEIQGSSTASVIYVHWNNSGPGFIELFQNNIETGCQDSLIQTISINHNPNEIILGDTIVCENSDEIYTTFADSSYYILWRIDGGIILGDSTQNTIAVNWGHSNKGIVSLIRINKSDSLKEIIDLKIQINPKPIANIYGNNEACEKDIDFYFTDTDSLTLSQWSVSNGEIVGSGTADTVKVKWNDIDLPSIKGYVTLNKTNLETTCSASITMAISISQKPNPVILGDDNVCINQEYLYIAENSVANINNWKIESGKIISTSDSSVKVLWKNVGVGSVTLIQEANNKCKDSTVMKTTINPLPERPKIKQIGKQLQSSAVKGNQWFVFNKIILGANNQIFTPDSSGIYSVQVTDDNSCISEMSKPYNFDINDVKEKKFDKIINLYPNPANEFVYLKINSQFYNTVLIQISDIWGRSISAKEQYGNNQGLYKYDIKNLNKGIYFFSIYLDKKFIKNYKLIKY